MAIDILFPSKCRAKVGSLQLDASVKETHQLPAKVTSFPVEDGGTITDHIQNDPRQLTLEGFVTDTQVKYLAGIRDGLDIISGSGTPSKSAFDELERLYEARSPIEVVTGLKTYSNMAIESLEIPRDAKTGYALRFTAKLKQVRLTTFQTTELPVEKVSETPANAKDQAQGAQNVGKQATQAATDSEKEITSVLYDLGKSLGWIQ